MNPLSPAFVGAIRRSLAHKGDRRMAQMKVGHPAFVGGFRESHRSRSSGKLYSLISTDSLSTFSGEDQWQDATQGQANSIRGIGSTHSEGEGALHEYRGAHRMGDQNDCPTQWNQWEN